MDTCPRSCLLAAVLMAALAALPALPAHAVAGPAPDDPPPLTPVRDPAPADPDPPPRIVGVAAAPAGGS